MNSCNDPGETTVEDQSPGIEVVCGRTLDCSTERRVFVKFHCSEEEAIHYPYLGEHLDWMKSYQENPTRYKVLVNHEDQYSIWPADRKSPLGWTDTGKSGDKAECLAYIKQVWTDMRPLSLRKRMGSDPIKEG